MMNSVSRANYIREQIKVVNEKIEAATDDTTKKNLQMILDYYHGAIQKPHSTHSLTSRQIKDVIPL